MVEPPGQERDLGHAKPNWRAQTAREEPLTVGSVWFMAASE